MRSDHLQLIGIYCGNYSGLRTGLPETGTAVALTELGYSLLPAAQLIPQLPILLELFTFTCVDGQ